MFSQLLKLFPQTEFQALVKRTHAERPAAAFACWGSSGRCCSASSAPAHSFRETCGELRSSEGYALKLPAPGLRRRATDRRAVRKGLGRPGRQEPGFYEELRQSGHDVIVAPLDSAPLSPSACANGKVSTYDGRFAGAKELLPHRSA